MLDFRFSNSNARRDIDDVQFLLTQPRLWIPGGDYPAHKVWRERALTELEQGKKVAMLARWSINPVGSIVYQRSKTDSDVLKIKNVSVEEAARGRHVADFLLRQVEKEGPIDVSVQVDTKVTNARFLSFAAHSGYRIVAVTKLDSMEHNGVADVVLSKPLQE